MPFRFPKNLERNDGVPLRDAVARTGRARLRIASGKHSPEVIHQNERDPNLYAWGNETEALPHPANHNEVAWLSEQQVTDTYGDRWFPTD